jgi:hypothetical protein
MNYCLFGEIDMAKSKTQVDVGALQQLIERGQEAEQMKEKIRSQVAKVEAELQALRALIAGEKGKGARGRKPGGVGKKKQDQPKPGSAPARLCELMSSTEPVSVEELARKTGLSEGTVKVYIHQFGCFKSAGRGKGYICTAARAGASQVGEMGTARKRKKKAAKKRTAGK